MKTSHSLTRNRRLHHTGFVVASIEAGIGGFLTSLAATWDGNIYNDPLQKVRVAFVSTGPEDALIELVESNAPDSPVQRFLHKNRGGLHHLCYEVKNLDEELAATSSRGDIIAAHPKPAVAFDGRRIAWVVTREGLLVELLEAAQQG